MFSQDFIVDGESKDFQIPITFHDEANFLYCLTNFVVKEIF